MSGDEGCSKRQRLQTDDTNLITPIPVIMDVDTGIDDAFALLLALLSPNVELLGITCVCGNTNVDQVCENTLKVLDAADATDVKVACGFSQPLIEPVHYIPEIHGNDGIGDLMPPLPKSNRKIISENAVDFIVETLEKALSPITIIALAPLTNIAMVFRTAPDLCKKKIQRIIWMGGSLFTGGNRSSWGECNAQGDPEAAHIVLSSGLPITLYPWDVFLKISFSKEDIDALQNPSSSSASNLACRLLKRNLKHWANEPKTTIGDAGAVIALIKPSVMRIKRMHVVMELHGQHTRGMTVCDLRSSVSPCDNPKKQANVDCIVDLDVDAAKKVFADTVLAS